MGAALRDRPGGIVGLLGQTRETWAALEADLLNVGLTLDDYPDRLNLRAITAFLFWADQNDSAVARHLRGPKAGWGHTQELLARIIEVLQDANWQRQGIKTAPKPKPVPRPGEQVEGTRHLGDAPMSIADFERRMAERRVA